MRRRDPDRDDNTAAWLVLAILGVPVLGGHLMHALAALLNWHRDHGPIEAALVLLTAADLF